MSDNKKIIAISAVVSVILAKLLDYSGPGLFQWVVAFFQPLVGQGKLGELVGYLAVGVMLILGAYVIIELVLLIDKGLSKLQE